MKAEVTVAQDPTLFAKLKARTERQKARVREATIKSADRAFAKVQDDVPRDTHYMAEHTRIDFIEEGLGYLIGWHRGDFVGQVNPVTERVMTTFYPYWVHHGARGKAGRDVLTPALRSERGNYRRAVTRALGK